MQLILSLLWIGTLLEPGATVRPYIHPFSMITCNVSTSPAEVDGEDGFLPGLIGDNETQVNGSGEMWWEEEEEEEVKPDVRKRNYLSSLQASLGCAWLSHWTSREVSGVTMLFPMYLHVILAALSLGAQGSTADSLQEILGFSDNGCGGISGSQRSHDMRWHFRLLLRDILTHHRSSLSTGSWMVFQEGLRLRQTFARQLRHFHPEVRLGAVNFRQPQMAEESINNLIHRATAGRLDNLVTGLSPSTNLVVTSFVHFKGKWKTRSQCHGTELQDFFNDAGDKTQVLMMIWCGWLQYKTASNYTLIQLPMSETMYMILIQTVQPATMEEIMKMLPVDKTVKDFQTGFVRLVMPRFAWEGTYNVKEKLSQVPETLGGQADFSRLSSAQQLVPEQVIHSIIFEVTEDEEEQTTAEDLAVSNTTTTTTEIRFNKPFVFRVYDGALDMLLFLGSVKRFPLKSELKIF